MSIVSERKDYYIQRKKENESNIVKGIPWNLTFPKLGSIIPVIPPGYQILWTAGSGIGKTQTWIGIILYSIYDIKKKHPELNLHIKLVIALLEDTKEMFIDRLFSLLLNKIYGIRLDGFELQSMRSDPLNDKYLPMIDHVEKEIEILLEDCELIDSVYNPTGIYKWCRSISNKYGKHVYKDKEFTADNKTKHMESVYSHYELKKEYENTQFVLILDNMNNLSTELKDGRLLDERQTINRWSREYCRLQIAKHWHWSIVNVIQQAADSEKQQFDNKGKSIIEKIKPSLDGLGNSKETQRDEYKNFVVSVIIFTFVK